MKRATTLISAHLLAGLLLAGTALADGHRSFSDAHWTWTEAEIVGASTLIRTPQGVRARFRTTGLAAGHAMTLWIAVINNPAACTSTPCSQEDFSNPDTASDFLHGGGRISNSEQTTFAGHLRVGDTSGSGWIEFGLPELAVGLTNPMGAEVHLVIRSHGPALTGDDLAAQLGSYLGGCEVFLGDEGNVATGPEDVPVAPGECSDIQASVYVAPGAGLQP